MLQIIIDANVAGEFPDKSAEAAAILNWLKVKGVLAVGGKNLMELQRTRLGDLVAVLKNAGRAVQYDDEAIEKIEVTLQEISSDDPHVLALAIESAARILYSRDKLLHADFTNPNIIKKPRGKCFSDALVHSHLLK